MTKLEERLAGLEEHQPAGQAPRPRAGVGGAEERGRVGGAVRVHARVGRGGMGLGRQVGAGCSRGVRHGLDYSAESAKRCCRVWAPAVMPK